MPQKRQLTQTQEFEVASLMTYLFDDQSYLPQPPDLDRYNQCIDKYKKLGIIFYSGYDFVPIFMPRNKKYSADIIVVIKKVEKVCRQLYIDIIRDVAYENLISQDVPIAAIVGNSPLSKEISMNLQDIWSDPYTAVGYYVMQYLG